MSPAYAFISVGSDNSYGHPTAETLETLENAGCSIYRTDVQNEVTLYTDGSTVLLSDEPFDESMLPNEDEKTIDDSLKVDNAEDADTYESSDENLYILNTNTKKFHYASCDSVSQMNEKNKKEHNGSRDEAISQGYDPCKNCNP